AQPAGTDRGPADARARRRGDRVRAPAPGRAARRRESSAARLARARRDPVALRPNPRSLRRADRDRVPAGRERGGGRDRDDGRKAHRGGVSEAAAPPPPLEEDPEAYAPSVARRMAFYQSAGGFVTPFLTAVFAFLMGGIVVAATGHNPLRVYKAIFEGAGLNWFFHFGSYHIDLPFTNHHIWFWWNTSTNTTPAYNLTQTLLTMTPLILTGLAVSFAFRCGLFNIGGQGQYITGAIVGVDVGSRFVSMGHFQHVALAIVLASLAGAFWGAIAGFLKATVGAHEVITTIMLNWIAYWAGSYFFG